MDLFWKTAAVILLALVMGIVLEQQGKDISVLLTIAVCCVAAAAAFTSLEPAWAFIQELKAMTRIQSEVLDPLLKIVGIALVSEVITMICADAGNRSLGKALQFAGSAVILYLSVPVFRSVLTAVQDILGGL